MGLLDKVRVTISEALNPQRAGESKELAYLRQIYGSQNGGVQRNQWYRILGPSGDHVGFEFCCACGTSYQLLHINDWLGRQHQCPTCKTQFDLLKACGISNDVTPAQWPAAFAKLPVRPRLAGARPRPNAVSTWDDSEKEVVQWAGGKPDNQGWV